MNSDHFSQHETREEIRAKRIQKQYEQNTTHIQPNSVQLIYVASLYIAHILEGNPKTYQEFCRVYSIEKKQLYKYIKAITLKLHIDISIKTETRIIQATESLEESVLIIDQCKSIIERLVERHYQFVGNYMADLASILYIVRNQNGLRTSSNQLCERFSIAQSVFKKHRANILDALQ